ncbi:MAG: phosphoenolpyruvate--protein phosphotransferase [Pseudonocardiaceae bacterium]
MVVGLVVVSHSRALAQAAVALAQEMLPSQPVRIEVAAGLDDTTFGTDAGQIRTAITAADQGAGVVILMDLGSAVLSAELALELLEGELRDRVLLCPAPLVEGLVVAAVTAAGGASREEVAAEASGALAGKTSHLGAPPAPVPDDLAAGELTGCFTVRNPHGLHARPAAQLVQAVRRLDAQVSLRNSNTGSAWVSGASLPAVATLGALSGHEVQIRVGGRRAREALEHLLALAAGGFGDAPTTSASDNLETAAPGRPIGAAPGVGIGPACSLPSAPIDVTETGTADPAAEWRRLTGAIAAVSRTLQRVRARAAAEVGEADAAIFDAHLLLLDDAELLGEVRARIEGGQPAAPAWSAAITRVGTELAALPDPYLRARAADLSAVGDQVLRTLLGVPTGQGPQAGVLVAGDLTPAEATGLDRSRIAAVVLAFGSPAAHSTILLRARGVPAVVGAGPAVLSIAEGTLLAVDGTRGEIVIDPAPEVRAAFRARAAERARREHRARAHAAEPAITRDGVEIRVGANVSSVEDACAAAAGGADLAGLVRTEFLFLGRTQAPSVDEQEATYREIAGALGGRRVVLRTLDAGGDKPLGYLPRPAEANPVLGLRGIRLSLAQPRLLADQLLAIARVAHEVPVSVLFPMISTLDELIRARRMLADTITLTGRGQPTGLQVGIMVEVPATALKASAFAPHVEFFSVGTNDLTQYALAADRGNDAVASLGDPFDPGVLQLVAALCRAAAETPVSVCGELAADERATALLVGLGVRELSVTPRAIPTIKQTLRDLDSRAATALAATALTASSARAVRALATAGPTGERLH